MSDKVRDKKGNPIEEGDSVFSKIRGGKQEGEVDKIIMNDEEAKRENVKHPPKVMFKDQHGHYVARNPGTVEIVEKEKEG